MGNEATIHVRFDQFAICRPQSLVAAANSHDCIRCEQKLNRLLDAACQVVEVTNDQSVDALRKALAACHLDCSKSQAGKETE